eukprot:CAMPEP_0206501084 /NCGR_PEP_ID=MMETSP0324_2-20121206/53060_1 /ASSEMBLY_ACC=CAM_ASM_000836 /TAXON_ID=2866 /ORGANISM="Crypthecodinium cohnii, Strain Seligo" /LENGTH=92 /DNA_ID=CAMNT_0053988757 /DNA_START=44 /DNA_END=319 /DNA_ORIENTATION=+
MAVLHKACLAVLLASSLDHVSVDANRVSSEKALLSEMSAADLEFVAIQAHQDFGADPAPVPSPTPPTTVQGAGNNPAPGPGPQNTDKGTGNN